MSNNLEVRPKALLQPSTVQEAMQYAEMMAKSSLVPESFRGKPGDVLIAVQMGAEMGMTPVQALQHIAVINGRASVWGDGLLGLVLASGLMENYKEMTQPEIEAAQQATFWCVRKGMPEPIIRSFSVADAKRANLWGNPQKKPIWVQYPWRMLQMRARSWALRDGFADVLKGLQCREEVEDYEPKNITPAPVAIQPPRRLSERPAAVESDPQADPPSPEPENQETGGPPESGEVITSPMQKRFFAICREAGWKDAEVKDFLLREYNLHSSSDMLKSQYDSIISAIQMGGKE